MGILSEDFVEQVSYAIESEFFILDSPLSDAFGPFKLDNKGVVWLLDKEKILQNLNTCETLKELGLKDVTFFRAFRHNTAERIIIAFAGHMMSGARIYQYKVYFKYKNYTEM